MTFAHVLGIPVEESALALAPAGAAIASGLAVLARSTAGRIVGWLGHRSARAARGSPSRSASRCTPTSSSAPVEHVKTHCPALIATLLAIAREARDHAELVTDPGDGESR
jgi:hypothetical protein